MLQKAGYTKVQQHVQHGIFLLQQQMALKWAEVFFIS